jgi:GNAT superfamily N-acetyltransferase
VVLARRAQVDLDVSRAWLYGYDLQEITERVGIGPDGSTTRLLPYVERLLDALDADPGRLRAAAAGCRDRLASLVAQGVDPRSRRSLGYARAAALADAALEALRVAGPPRPHLVSDLPRSAPALVPVARRVHAWPLRAVRLCRKLSPAWWRRRAEVATARIVYHLTDRARDVRVVEALVAGRPIGQIRYHVCAGCRVAGVDAITVDEGRRGVGIGARLVAAALRTAPVAAGYQWHVVAQPDEVTGFWRRMDRRHRVGLSAVPALPCVHMQLAG